MHAREGRCLSGALWLSAGQILAWRSAHFPSRVPSIAAPGSRRKPRARQPRTPWHRRRQPAWVQPPASSPRRLRSRCNSRQLWVLSRKPQARPGTSLLPRPSASVRRQDRRGELQRPALRCPIPHPGHFQQSIDIAAFAHGAISEFAALGYAQQVGCTGKLGVRCTGRKSVIVACRAQAVKVRGVES